VEKRLRIMRGVLETLAEARHPVTVVTKGALVERDADILGEMGRAGLARVGVSITTLDRALARAMEPRAAAPDRRLAAIRRLTEAGCPVRVMVAPVVPGLTDMELERILAAAREAGAVAAGYVLLRLPGEVAALFQEWLAEFAPGKAAKVMRAVRATHGGRDYDSAWGVRMTGTGIEAELLRRRFALAVRRLGFAERLPPLDLSRFRPPVPPGGQLTLF
jgi:DNA repair photolyase